MTSCAVLASSRTATCHTVVSVSWPDPDINEHENGGFITWKIIMIMLRIIFSFKDKEKKMRLQIHILIEK
jgi:hypothetical protein